MTRAVGLPLAEAFVAFDAGRYAETVEKIGAVRGIAQRFGGSHAQRDILTLTTAARGHSRRHEAGGGGARRGAPRPQAGEPLGTGVVPPRAGAWDMAAA